MQLRMQLLTHAPLMQLRMQLLTHLRMQLLTQLRMHSVDSTAHCMQAEDCVGWTEDCQASEVREDCQDARSWGACWFAWFA